MRGCVALILAATLALAGCGAEREPQSTASAAEIGAPAQYCEDSGGDVQQRQPTYGTNNDESAWVPLGEPFAVCKLATTGDGTAIFVDLDSLASERPTLAALAYLQASAPQGLKPSGNPAAAICTAIGGTSSYGPGANGGGLVDTEDAAFPVIQPCTFADGSFIDEWGIAYHQDGSIRGADLAPLFRFDGAAAPHVFD